MYRNDPIANADSAHLVNRPRPMIAAETVDTNAERDAKIDRLVRKINATDAESIRINTAERDAYDAMRAELATLRAEQAASKAGRDAEEAAAFAAEWTLETTVARRAEWNAALKSMGKAATGAALQAKCGFSLITLKRAIAAHNL